MTYSFLKVKYFLTLILFADVDLLKIFDLKNIFLNYKSNQNKKNDIIISYIIKMH